MNNRLYDNKDVKILNGKISQIGDFTTDDEIIDVSGMFICLGFIDIHIHGGDG